MLRPCFVCAVVCLAAGTCAAADRPADFESLVDQLQKVGEPSVGVSTEVAGPLVPSLDGGPGKPGFMVLGSPPPKLAAPAADAPMDALVAAGASSVPVLLKHLDDKRATALPEAQGGQWTDYSTEYDYNHRTLKAVPKGVNVDDENNGNRPHVITVGDLCFVVLGEIVNRNFNAVRLSPGGGIVVNSPTESKTLCDAARAEFGGMNTERLRALLTDDFLHPDLEERRIGAYRCLARFFPGDTEHLVLGQLAVPVFDGLQDFDFVRDKLYGAASVDDRRKLLDDFIKQNGAAAKDGVMLELFEDLERKEDVERGGHISSLYYPLACLVDLYGYPPTVKSTDAHYVETWDTSERARFIAELTLDKSEKIDEVLYKLLQDNIGKDDYLAARCIPRLIGRGRDDELRKICEARVAATGPDGTAPDGTAHMDWTDVLARLNKAQGR